MITHAKHLLHMLRTVETGAGPELLEDHLGRVGAPENYQLVVVEDQQEGSSLLLLLSLADTSSMIDGQCFNAGVATLVPKEPRVRSVTSEHSLQ